MRPPTQPPSPLQDITGTASIRLHKDTNKPDRQLFHDDIDGSFPRNKWLFRTTRCVNPLNPEYDLPSFVAAPAVDPKFTRNSYDVSDIVGTKSKPLFPLKQRQNHLVDDIEGAQSGWKPRHVRARHDAAPLDYSLNVRDITGGGFRTRRATNPLEPSYRVNGMDVADDPVKSKPKALPKARDSPFYPLVTLDIEGAQPGWRPLPQMNPPLEARRHFRNTNYMGDIPGAQADTVKHSICTERRVDPLNPVYTSLDGTPLTNPQTPLYKEPACQEAEAQLSRIIAAEEVAAASSSTATPAATAAATSSSSPNRSPEGSGLAAGRARDKTNSGKRNEQPEAVSTPPCPSQQPLQPMRDGGSSGGKAGGAGGASEARGGGRFSARSGDTTPGARGPSLAGSMGFGKCGVGKDELIRRLEQEEARSRSLRQEDGEVWRKRPPSGATPSARQGKSNVKTNGSNRSGGSRGRSGRGDDAGGSARSWPESLPGRRRQETGTVSQGVKALATSSSDGRCRMKAPLSTGGDAPLGRPGRSRSMDGDRGMERGGSDRQRGLGGGAMVIRSRGERGGQDAERLVLRSANGTPRVSLTPSEKRSAREYTEDVSSVRALF